MIRRSEFWHHSQVNWPSLHLLLTATLSKQHAKSPRRHAEPPSSWAKSDRCTQIDIRFPRWIFEGWPARTRRAIAEIIYIMMIAREYMAPICTHAPMSAETETSVPPLGPGPICSRGGRGESDLTSNAPGRGAMRPVTESAVTGQERSHRRVPGDTRLRPASSPPS
jgi:hypothetical protein